jgi:hypothetical protein
MKLFNKNRRFKSVLYLYVMLQQILVIALFAVAALYLSRLIFRSFQAKNACESGCGKCGALDLQKIENELKAKEL